MTPCIKGIEAMDQANVAGREDDASDARKETKRAQYCHATAAGGTKTPARLSNCVGIIDSGYRGNLGGYFDVVNGHELFEPSKLSRLAQICAPALEPFNVIIVQTVEELGSTLRGTGGFGSTGN